MKKSFLLIEIRKDDFISMASHEFKTPITSIKIFSKILSRSILIRNDQVLTSYLSQIDQQVNRLNDLVDNILNVSRINSKEFNLSYEHFSLKQLITDSIETAKFNNGFTNIIYDNSIDFIINADREKIKTAINGLLDNAIKYSPKDREVIIKSELDIDGLIKITIQDFGIGIDKKYHQKIFKNFYRIPDNYGQTYPGLGMGLYLASEIVKLHHGSLSVKSSLGDGSTFTIKIPKSSPEKVS
jgi:signal transduction histidine kinase